MRFSALRIHYQYQVIFMATLLLFIVWVMTCFTNNKIKGNYENNTKIKQNKSEMYNFLVARSHYKWYLYSVSFCLATLNERWEIEPANSFDQITQISRTNRVEAALHTTYYCHRLAHQSGGLMNWIYLGLYSYTPLLSNVLKLTR